MVPHGGQVNPNHVASTIGALGVSSYLGITYPPYIFVVIVLCIPMGYVMAQIETIHRRYENRSASKLANYTLTAGRLLLASQARMGMVNVLSFLILSLLVFSLIKGLEPHLASFSALHSIRWWHIWILSSIGAILSLQYKPAKILLMAGGLLITVYVCLF